MQHSYSSETKLVKIFPYLYGTPLFSNVFARVVAI